MVGKFEDLDSSDPEFIQKMYDFQMECELENNNDLEKARNEYQQGRYDPIQTSELPSLKSKIYKP